MATKLFVWQGDIAPIVLLTILDQYGDPLDLSTALANSLKFSMIDYQTKRVQLSNETARSFQTDTNEATLGQIAYQWQSGDTDRCGLYRGYFTVDFGTGPQTFPQNDDLFILITAKG